MTERLADISARIEGVRQLGSVVNAMRGIAAARAQQARSELLAVESYSATLGAAIGRAMAMDHVGLPDAGRYRHRRALVVFVAEQGFVGAFSEPVLAALQRDEDARTGEALLLFMVGSRGVTLAAERAIRPAWSAALPSQSAGIPKLADRIAEALYGRLASGEVERLDVLHSRWQPGQGISVVRRRLFPLDPTLFASSAEHGTLANLPAADLLQDIAADYIHARLCDAALHSFAAENEARMVAMASARSHIEQQLVDLEARRRQIRQEEITAEILELAAGEAASRAGAPLAP